MKSFRRKRPIPEHYAKDFQLLFGDEGKRLSETLESSLPAFPIPSIISVNTAFMNDKNSEAVFAQSVFGLGKPGDLLWALSTSGNSRNIIYACMAARVKGMKILAMTGRSGGRLKDFSDVVIQVPSDRTEYIQELHLPVYHALCAMLEDTFFAAKE